MQLLKGCLGRVSGEGLSGLSLQREAHLIVFVHSAPEVEGVAWAEGELLFGLLAQRSRQGLLPASPAEW